MTDRDRALDIARLVCDLFGVDFDRCQGLTFHIDKDNPPIADFTMIASGDGMTGSPDNVPSPPNARPNPDTRR